MSVSRDPLYQIILKSDNLKSTRSTGLLLAMLAIIVLLTRYFGASGSYLNIISACLILLCLIIISKQTRSNKETRYFPVFLIAGFTLVLVPPFNFIGIFYLLLIFLESFSLRPITVDFFENGLRIKNGLFIRNHDWEELSNILLKDGLLTLDFQNNRLFQKETLEMPGFPVDEFNLFCLQKLIK